jgi:glycosyltransferase involved in cell wall biosynthesis
MNIEVYTCCWNEADIMPYFLRHYETFASRIIVYDNDSDDGTQRIVAAHPKAELRAYSSGGKLDDTILNGIYNSCWKGSTADYVMCVDADEFLSHANIVQFLKDCKENGVDLPRVEGYTMASEQFGDSGLQIYDSYQSGFRDSTYDKPSVFNPRLNFKFGVGMHWGWVEGSDKFQLSSFEPIFLLHYKYMGRERYIKKRQVYDQRLSDTNKENHWGVPRLDAEANFNMAIESAHVIVH